MHYALCITPAVLCLLSCPTVLFCAVQPVHLCVFVSKIRSENKFAILFDSGLHFLFFARLRGWAAEEDKKDGEEDLGISWVVFCGWRECRCGEPVVKWEVVGEWVLMNGSHVAAATEDFLVW